MKNKDKPLSKWKIQKLKRAYYKLLKANLITQEYYLQKIRELNKQEFK